MKSKKFLIFVLIGLVIIFVAFYLSKSQVNNKTRSPLSPSPEVTGSEKTTQEEQYTVTVSVDFGNGKVEKDEILLKKPSTAYDALVAFVQAKNLKINTKQYEFGVFVESINDFESNKDKAWIYFVNGKSGAVAADKQEVAENDLVEWKYVAPAAE